MLQSDWRHKSPDQVAKEANDAYAAIELAETKCKDSMDSQSSNTSAEQRHALFACHQTLLHHHDDFFMITQYPFASAQVRQLPSKYNTPARMWRNCILSFIEFLQRGLPASREHMLEFFDLAHGITVHLHEDLSALLDPWINCIGDLGRYRMAIEDDVQEREVWARISYYWYTKAANKLPTTGRSYHHLAILAQHDPPQSLFYFAKSLCVPVPFWQAKESIMAIFEPALNSDLKHLSPIDAAFAQVHAILFSGKAKERLTNSMEEFLVLLDNHIGRMEGPWLESGLVISSFQEYISHSTN